MKHQTAVIPAKAGIQCWRGFSSWTPAFAGVTASSIAGRINRAAITTNPILGDERQMKKGLSKLVGRYVRLKTVAFSQVAQGAQRCAIENLFVVAAIAQGMNKLICYGGNLRIAVSPSDLVMV